MPRLHVQRFSCSWFGVGPKHQYYFIIQVILMETWREGPPVRSQLYCGSALLSFTYSSDLLLRNSLLINIMSDFIHSARKNYLLCTVNHLSRDIHLTSLVEPSLPWMCFLFHSPYCLVQYTALYLTHGSVHGGVFL